VSHTSSRFSQLAQLWRHERWTRSPGFIAVYSHTANTSPVPAGKITCGAALGLVAKRKLWNRLTTGAVGTTIGVGGGANVGSGITAVSTITAVGSTTSVSVVGSTTGAEVWVAGTSVGNSNVGGSGVAVSDPQATNNKKVKNMTRKSKRFIISLQGKLYFIMQAF
jgi:hypothetical protein